MHVVIKDISQALSLETGRSYSYLTVMLPNGKEVRASVSDDAIAEITQLFMQSGSPAAQAAADGVARSMETPPPVESFPRHQPPQQDQQQGSYSPMEMTEDADGELVETFGGDFNPEDDPQLAEVGAALLHANTRMAQAVGDVTSTQPTELRQVVGRLTQQEPVLPVPSIMTPTTPARQRAKPHVEADAMGNPIIKGPGLVDPRGIMGGNTEGEEDAGQV